MSSIHSSSILVILFTLLNHECWYYYFTKLHYLWIVLVWFFPILISEWILILSDTSIPTWILVLERFLPTFKVSAYWGVEFLNLEEVEKILWTLEMGRGKICACCFFEKPFNIGALGLRKANQSILEWAWGQRWINSFKSFKNVGCVVITSILLC